MDANGRLFLCACGCRGAGLVLVGFTDHGKDKRFAIVLWFASWLDTLPQAILIGILQVLLQQ